MQKLNSENDKTFLPTRSNIRSSNRNSTLENRKSLNCLLCQQAKRVKLQKQKKSLIFVLNWLEKQKKLIKKASLLHNDPRIAALCTDDLIAKEAAYHKSCYPDFTRIVTANKPGTTEEEN